MENIEERIRYWIDIADYDLETADAMLATGRFLYVGFMCHQVIEKLLKAYYISLKNEVPPFSHNLAFLAKQSDIYDNFTEEQLRPDTLHIRKRY